MRKLMILSGWLLCLAGFLAGGLTVLGISGKYNLKRQAVSYAAQAGSAGEGKREAAAPGTGQGSGAVPAAGAGQEKGAVPAAGAGQADGAAWEISGRNGGRLGEQAGYRGTAYAYNRDILSFLFLGTDAGKKEEASGGGQAEALFLLVLNPHEKTIQAVPIDCNTMAAVDIYDAEGVYQETVPARIGTQYGFGGGGETGCEYQVKAVSRFLCGIPIHGYLAVDMEVFKEAVELAGGVELRVLSDVRNGQGQVILRQGEQALLDGEQAYWYVRGRQGGVPLSAEAGLERQRQFLAEFINTINRQTGQDAAFPLRLFYGTADRAVTDITADEAVYLAAAAGGCHFDAGQVLSIPGESVSGEGNTADGCDEFYADEEGLYELVLDVFYEAVE